MPQPRELVIRHVADEPDRARRAVGPPCAQPLSVGPVAGDDQLPAGDPAGVDRHLDSLLRRQPGDEEHGPAVDSGRGRGELPDDVGDDEGGPERSAECAQPGLREPRRDDKRVGLVGEALLPQHQAGPVGGSLRPRATAVEHDAGECVAAMAARALVAVAEAHADRAHHPVLVQVQYDGGARLARGGQRPPAEGGVDIVGVDDAGTRSPDRGCDLVRFEPSAQQPRRRPRPADVRRAALEQFGVLAEPFAHQPLQFRDGTFLSAGAAIAMVQEQDHDGAAPSGEDTGSAPAT